MSQAAPLMAGKKGLILGIANERSLAWGITRAVAEHGAELALTFQGEALAKRVRPLAESIGASLVLPCDVTDPASLDALFATVGEEWRRLDFVVHAIAFSDKEQLKGKYLETTAANFERTMMVSCYSFTELCRRAAPLMADGGSMLTLTYAGAERVMPHYNVMGVAKAALEASVRYLAVDLGGERIRVNAISAGPVRTLAASGIGDFRYILKWNELNAPLKRNTTLEDVGGAALYLLSDLGAGTTGEVLHVDSGYHVVGMKAVDAPDIATV
jgi:enoyl-[acyl-carrier protein] reductase I